MRNPYLSFFFALSCVILYTSAYPVFAEAPASAKIAFSSWRDGNLDIYLMNPDGSEEVRLTHHPRDPRGFDIPHGRQKEIDSRLRGTIVLSFDERMLI